MLTHGHEDHIGAVPYLLRLKADIPLIGSQLTLALVEAKLKEHRIKPYTLTVKEGQRERLGRLRLRVRRGQPLDPRRARRGDPHPGRHAAAHRRLQDGPAAAGRPADRPARVRPARRGGGRPLPHRLHQRRGARASPRPSATSPRPSTGSSTRPSGGSSSPASPPTCTACSRSSTPPPPTAARSPWSAARCCATWASPRSWATCTCRPGVLVDVKKLDDLPDDQVVLICTGSQGEPMAALSRMANRDHRIEVGEGDTVAAGLLAHPRQRERRLPRHQRPDAPRRRRRAQGQRQGPRLRARQRRRAALLLQHRQAAQRDAGARRVAPPHRQRRPRRRHRGPARPAWCWPRTAWWSTSSTAGPRSPVRCRAATSTSTAPPSAAPPRRC